MPEVGHTPSKLLPFTATLLFLRCPLMTAIMQYDRRKALKIMSTSRFGGNCGSFIQYGILKSGNISRTLPLKCNRAEQNWRPLLPRAVNIVKDAMRRQFGYIVKKKKKKKKKDRRPTDPIFFSHVTRNKVFFFLA